MSSDPRIGTEVAGYRIEALLGRGGMSTVYLAEDTRLERRVALKILAPDLAEDERFRIRFVRESHLAAALEHPNIVPIHEAGEASGLFFIAMRYVRGTDLGALIARDGPLDPGPAVAIIERVADALDAAHEEGLVHRDVKPANVLIGEGRGSRGEHVYLSDFGLTKRALSESGLTKTGQFMGTIDYAAPEVFQGKELDARTDQYSLGCVFYECITGRRPFAREQEAAVMYAHLNEPPPKPSEVRPGLPPRFDDVVITALAKSPDQRFASCGELAAEAKDVVGAPALPETRRRPGARVALVALGALVSAVIVGAIAIAIGGGNPDATSADGAGRPPSAASSSPSPLILDRALTGAERSLLAKVPEEIRSGCGAVAPAASFQSAKATIACIDGSVTVLYSWFESKPAMDAVYQPLVQNLQVPEGDCATDIKAHAEYTLRGDPSGQVTCFRAAGAAHIQWTDDNQFVYATAERADLADLDLFNWWLTEAGPLVAGLPGVAPESVVPKDVGDQSPDVLEGSFEATVSDEAARGKDAEFVLLTGGYGMELIDGQYRLLRSTGQAVDEGSYGLAKGGEIALSSTDQCPGVSGTYVYALERGTLAFQAREKDRCGGRDFILTAGPWMKAGPSDTGSPSP